MAKEISAESVQKLREITGLGVMDCRKALIEADGDIDEAKRIIGEKGIAKVEKRAGRETGAGLAYSYVHADRIGVLLELRAETDFVVRSEPFQKLAHELALQIAAVGGANVEELLAEPYVKDESKTVKDILNAVIAQVGENIVINQFYRIEA
jgi:elongation factor Ts